MIQSGAAFFVSPMLAFERPQDILINRSRPLLNNLIAFPRYASVRGINPSGFPPFTSGISGQVRYSVRSGVGFAPARCGPFGTFLLCARLLRIFSLRLHILLRLGNEGETLIRLSLKDGNFLNPLRPLLGGFRTCPVRSLLCARLLRYLYASRPHILLRLGIANFICSALGFCVYLQWTLKKYG